MRLVILAKLLVKRGLLVEIAMPRLLLEVVVVKKKNVRRATPRNCC